MMRTASMNFLDQFGTVLLDMNGTFMFGHDRFGPDEDYFATYRAVGGSSLRRDEMLAIWHPSLETLLTTYDDPQRFDDFPTLAEVFTTYGAAPSEIPVLERVFAAHEIGHVPDRREIPVIGEKVELGAKSLGFQKELVETVPDRNGRPVFELFRFVRTQPATTAP